MSIPKFNLSKLKESVSRQQEATKQDIRNLLLLDRLQSDISRQNQTKKSKSKSGEFYKVTINGYQIPLNDDKFYCDIEFTKYIGKKEWDNLTLRNYDIEFLQSLISDDIGLDWDSLLLSGDAYFVGDGGDKIVSQKYAEQHIEDVLKPYLAEGFERSTLLDNLGYFEENHLLKDTDRNSWEIDEDNASEMFGNYDPRHWNHISYDPYQSIQIERI